MDPRVRGGISQACSSPYPEAKVVLVERDVECWYPSFEGMIQKMYNPILHALQILDPQLIRPTATTFNCVNRDRKGFCLPN